MAEYNLRWLTTTLLFALVANGEIAVADQPTLKAIQAPTPTEIQTQREQFLEAWKSETNWDEIRSRQLTDQILSFLVQNDLDATARFNEIFNEILRDQDRLHRLSFKDQIRLLRGLGLIPVYWHLRKLSRESVATQTQQQVDFILSIPDRIREARLKLPTESPGYRVISTYPVTEEVRQKQKRASIDTQISNEISNLEGVRDEFNETAPAVLARYLLFVPDAEKLLLRIRNQATIDKNTYHKTEAEFRKLQELVNKSK